MASLWELKTVYTINDLLKANAVLDIESEYTRVQIDGTKTKGA